jgi:hypothetical protein
MWIDDIIEKRPDLRIGTNYFKDAIFFKLPSDIITEKDINKVHLELKDYCKKNSKIDQPLNIPTDKIISYYDLSIPPYNNTIYYFNFDNKLMVYWIIKFDSIFYNDIDYYGYIFSPFIVKNNNVLPWVNYNPLSNIDDIYPKKTGYRIDFLQNKMDFSVNVGHIELKYFQTGSHVICDEETDINKYTFVSNLLKINSLLNCVNVVKIKNNHSTKLQKTRIKKGKLPLQSYYTLQLKGVSKKYENLMTGLDPQWTNRIHLCRGHFKRYTEDNPLFGKYTGLWWWQPAVRGKNKKGIIFKDYELV